MKRHTFKTLIGPFLFFSLLSGFSPNIYAQTGRIDFFGTDGRPLAVLVDRGAGIEMLSSIPFEFAGKSLLVYRLSATGDTKTGWIRVQESNGAILYFPHLAVGGREIIYKAELQVFPARSGLGGMLTFEASTPQGEITSVASVLPSPPLHSALTPMEEDESSKSRTGIAFANRADKPADYLLALYDQDRRFVADVIISLPPLGQMARFVSELFTGINIPKRGLLLIVATYDSPSVSFQFRGDKFATAPVLQGLLHVSPATAVAE